MKTAGCGHKKSPFLTGFSLLALDFFFKESTMLHQSPAKSGDQSKMNGGGDLRNPPASLLR